MKAYRVAIGYSSRAGRLSRHSIKVDAETKADALAQVVAVYPRESFGVLSVLRDPADDWRIEYNNVWMPLWLAAQRNCPRPRNRRLNAYHALRLCFGFVSHGELVRAMRRPPASARQAQILKALGSPNGRIFMKLRLMELKTDTQFDWENRM